MKDYRTVYCGVDKYGIIHVIPRINHQTIYFTRKADCQRAVDYNNSLPLHVDLTVQAFRLQEVYER